MRYEIFNIQITISFLISFLVIYKLFTNIKLNKKKKKINLCYYFVFN